VTPATTSPGRTGRAAPMAPADRRAAIVAATIPLLRQHGVNLSTRQIAEAACVAEGTIFSVFADKDSLIAAAVDAALDPAGTIDRIAAVDLDLDVADRLVAVVSIVQDHVASTWQLLSAVGSSGPPPKRPAGASIEASARLASAIEPMLEIDSTQLHHSTADSARALLALTVGCSHPAIVPSPMAPEQIVALLLDGIRGAAR
jgi:AcrR family transcriptional regulator